MMAADNPALMDDAAPAPDVTGDIHVDYRTGAVRGAAPHERLALLGMRIAVTILARFEDLGISKVARLIGTLFPSKKMMLVQLDEDARLRIPYFDPYWSALVHPQHEEAYELSTFVRLFKDVPYAFLDCGANYGIWSARVTAPSGGSKPSVAIEAASDTFRILEVNRALNNNRFRVINKAIGKVSGERVKIYGDKHEARSTVAPDADAKPILDCETISLADVAALPDFEGYETFVVKLDIEGVEIAALEGASDLLDGDTLVMFEEHGADPDHAVSDYAMNTLGMRLFYFHDDRCREIKSIDEFNTLKTSTRQGYDIAGTRSQKWIDRIAALPNDVRGE